MYTFYYSFTYPCIPGTNEIKKLSLQGQVLKNKNSRIEQYGTKNLLKNLRVQRKNGKLNKCFICNQVILTYKCPVLLLIFCEY